MAENNHNRRYGMITMSIRRASYLVEIFLISLLWYTTASHADNVAVPITLPEAEHLALTISPELQRLQANSNALNEQAVADDQLPDPQFMIGAANVPTNSFSFNQDDMTMVQVGLRQSFPRGHSLAFKSKQTTALAAAEQKKIQEQTAMLLRNVSEVWLDLYYWTQAAQTIHQNRFLYQYLFKVAKSQYSVGKGNQSDVLQAQLELSRLDDQGTQIQQQMDTLRAQLGRWISQDQADRPLAAALPNWPDLPPLDVLQMRLQQHPLLKVGAAKIDAARDAVAFAKEQYKPGWVLDVGYGVRQGHMMAGESRSDMVSAQVTVDLPFFTANRQDRTVRASAYQLSAAQLDQQIHYRDLEKELTAQYEIWQRLAQRENLYAKQLVPEAKQNSKASLLAYQNATTDLATVLRAYTNQLNIKLEQLQIQVERAKVRAALFYLEGITG